MEQNLPIITKKVWKMMKMALLMLRKGICKKKLVLDLNLMMKRAKITAKAAATATVVWPTNDPREYEFDCKNTPLYHHYFTNKSKNNHAHENNDYYIMPSPNFKDHVEFEAVNKVLETMVSNKRTGGNGNGKRRQLSISDAPFMLQNEGGNNIQRVDEAAEDFIKKFYSQLIAQDC